MKLKMLLNVLYTIGVVLSLYTIYWGATHQRYEFVMGAVFIGGILIMLKIKLLKEVRAMENPVKK
ncbi:hypothetical protein HH214_11415 [Mucilaginibacter robiniae]|uniref:Uncharacterized protein n=1 Tax=Mucilaginibacter robiniae TaxID=2728022 RepID=A0A7L5DZM5_9SPHI|nr:DUF6358 family protein [Mucilaginibacter robiniae]QJD96435.1 hypothetical protein HH214_11415 [Mucilaginibacter robiniae]